MDSHLIATLAEVTVVAGGLGGLLKVIWSLVQTVRDNTKAVQLLTEKLNGFDDRIEGHDQQLATHNRQLIELRHQVRGRYRVLPD